MKLVFAAFLLVFVNQVAFADAKYGMAGCGLGALAFGDKTPILAATTNDLSSAGFAISSGTSNCQVDPHAAAIQTQQKFFADNIQILSKEMAQGDGKYVRAFASTLGCRADAQAAFGAEMQRSYSEIFSAPGSNAMLNRVRHVIQDNKELSYNCSDAVI